MLSCYDVGLIKELCKHTKIAQVNGGRYCNYNKVTSTVGHGASHFDDKKVCANEASNDELHDLNGGYELGDDIR